MEAASDEPAPARHCVVGAGPAGLAAVRALLAHGLEVDCFERHTGVGGIWDRVNPGTPMYESAHFISSRTLSGYVGYPMPDHFPDYPRNDQVLAYVRDFAAAFDLQRHIQFGVSVDQAAWDGAAWVVRTSDGGVRRYRTLTCANGTQWHPNRPQLPGEDSFTGEIIHSRDYHSGRQLAGKRVLVVGAGNSGVDIVCDAAAHASYAALSMRRGYHLIPKHILGMPADVFNDSGPHVPPRIAQKLFPWLIRRTVGDVTALGWPKPDHKILETHPIVNDQIIHYLRHGDVAVRRDLTRFDGSDVVFADGRREPFDLVILATGYRTVVPYLDESVFTWAGHRPQLFLRLFDARRDGLACLGFSEGDGGAYAMFDDMADLIARTAAAAERDPETYARLRSRFAGPEPDLTDGMHYVASDRHSNYVNHHAWSKASAALRKEFGWPKLSEKSFTRLRQGT